MTPRTFHEMHAIMPFRVAAQRFTRTWKSRRRAPVPELSHALSSWDSTFDRWTLFDRNGKPVGTVSESGNVVLLKRTKA